jgi:hypothetical protein
MATIADLSDRDAVLKAIREHDSLGRPSFLAKYGYGRAKTWMLLHDGAEYDSKAIAGVAVLIQFGRRPTSLHGGRNTVVPRLRALGFRVVARTLTDGSAVSEEVPETLREGLGISIVVNRFERSAAARRICISKRGSTCLGCGFDFAAQYGAEFTGFIHVHHVLPLGRYRAERTVDPERDLIPVFANCHAAIHYGGECRSIDTVRDLIAKSRRDAS